VAKTGAREWITHVLVSEGRFGGVKNWAAVFCRDNDGGGGNGMKDQRSLEPEQLGQRVILGSFATRVPQ